MGLETALDELLSAGRRAFVVAVLGVALPFAMGAGFMAATGSDSAEALFVGAALSATSVGITARVLRDLGILDSTEANIILGAAVVDDILALLLLTAVSQIGEGDSVDVAEDRHVRRSSPSRSSRLRSSLDRRLHDATACTWSGSGLADRSSSR